MPMCSKCADLRKSIAKTPVISYAGKLPSTLELAYMVNVEYYMDMKYSCIHEVPEDKKATIKIKEMVDFLDTRKWELRTRTDYEGFKCSSFINRPSKQLVIVHRGTEGLDNWQQVTTDIMLAFKIITQEVIKKADWHTSQSLLNNALKEENQKFVRNDYSITVTGHSLGGWLAQICTLLSKYPKFHPVGPRGNIYFPNGKSIDMNQPYDMHCVAFDSPGASTILNRLELVSKLSAWLVGRKRDVENALKTLDITVYLSNPNPVNMCGDHVGNVEKIDVMSDVSYLSWSRLNPFASHSMEKILSYFKRNTTDH